MSKPETMMIDDVKYVREDSVSNIDKPNKDGLRYCVVRTYSAGVHIGYVAGLGEKAPQTATLYESRRLHYWTGAASLSQVAMDGVGNDSRVAVEVPEIILTDIIEVIPCSAKAAEFFKGVKAWKK